MEGRFRSPSSQNYCVEAALFLPIIPTQALPLVRWCLNQVICNCMEWKISNKSFKMLTELVNDQSTPTIFELYFSLFSTATFVCFTRILAGSIMKLYPELVWHCHQQNSIYFKYNKVHMLSSCSCLTAKGSCSPLLSKSRMIMILSDLN